MSVRFYCGSCGETLSGSKLPPLVRECGELQGVVHVSRNKSVDTVHICPWCIRRIVAGSVGHEEPT